MSRRRVVAKRETLPDAVHDNIVVARFIKHLMVSGKKSIAERIVYTAFDIIQEKLKRDPVDVFLRALANIKPMVEVKSRRIGGATYQVPIEVNNERGAALAMRWLIEFARKRSEKGMILRLVGEVVDAAGGADENGSGRGGAVKRREEVHRMAEANKAFSNIRV